MCVYVYLCICVNVCIYVYMHIGIPRKSRASTLPSRLTHGHIQLGLKLSDTASFR